MSFDMRRVPRVRINFLPTPLVELERLTRILEGPKILMKRDDLTGVALGGNKTRKLEFLLGEALDQGCDTVITGGAMQSNHCRQTSAACAATGLECHLALGGEAPKTPSGNLLLDHIYGANIHWCGDCHKGERIPEIAAQLRAAGRKPYIIPFGGSNAVGAMGFVEAMRELGEQISARGERIASIILPSSSGGTHAGMVVGAEIFDVTADIIGIGIDKGEPGEPSYESELASLANETAEKLGIKSRFGPDRFHMRYGYLGGGYGVVGDREREAVKLLGKHEGILLDPVYSARAMGALIDMIRRGEFTGGDTVVFWHTGGIPSVFEYGELV